MHEMALCESIVDIIRDEARRQNFGRVVAVRLERAVILFTFFEENRSLPPAEKLAGRVLARA